MMLFKLSDSAFSAVVRGEFDQLHLKIESAWEGRIYTFLTHKEVNSKIVRAIQHAANRILFNIPRITWATDAEVREIGKQFLTARLKNSKMRGCIQKLAYIGKGITKIEEGFPNSGCILDRRYLKEIGFICPEQQNISVYCNEVIEHYKEHCRDPHLDIRSWYATEEGKEILKKNTGSSDINDFRIKYLSKSARKAYLAEYIRVGREVVLFSQGKPLQTNPIPVPDEHAATHCSNCPDGLSIFVMGPDRQLYVGSQQVGKFQHSSFFKGQPVISAGEIVVDSVGKILFLSNRSGHYKPNRNSMLHLLAILKQEGVNLQGITLLLHESRTTIRGRFNAEEYLAAGGNCQALSNGITIQSEHGIHVPDLLMLL